MTLMISAHGLMHAKRIIYKILLCRYLLTLRHPLSEALRTPAFQFYVFVSFIVRPIGYRNHTSAFRRCAHEPSGSSGGEYVPYNSC